MAKGPGKGNSNNRFGTDSITRKFNRNLAHATREKIPGEVLLEFQLAILQGHDPTIVEDGRSASGWRVTWKEQGEYAPTLEQKQKAWYNITAWGYGLPVQQIVLDAELRQHFQTADSSFDVSKLATLAPEQQLLLRDAMRLMTGSNGAEGSTDGQEDEVDPLPSDTWDGRVLPANIGVIEIPDTDSPDVDSDE